MGLDVATPPPPTLDPSDSVADYEDADVRPDGDLRREELDEFLSDGAWAEAFADWAADTDLDPAAHEVARDLELFAEYDFFWDDFAGRVGFHAPGIPEDWRERDLHPDLDSWGAVSGINAALTELGRAVADRLEEAYVDWDADYEAPDDLPDF
jgi:hypothetical protein